MTKGFFRQRPRRRGRTDTERVRFLQQNLDRMSYTGRCILRWSESGRGWRLHETSRSGSSISVRDAIDRVMDSAEAVSSFHG